MPAVRSSNNLRDEDRNKDGRENEHGDKKGEDDATTAGGGSKAGEQM